MYLLFHVSAGFGSTLDGISWSTVEGSTVVSHCSVGGGIPSFDMVLVFRGVLLFMTVSEGNLRWLGLV